MNESFTIIFRSYLNQSQITFKPSCALLEEKANYPANRKDPNLDEDGDSLCLEALMPNLFRLTIPVN